MLMTCMTHSHILVVTLFIDHLEKINLWHKTEIKTFDFFQFWTFKCFKISLKFGMKLGSHTFFYHINQLIIYFHIGTKYMYTPQRDTCAITRADFFGRYWALYTCISPTAWNQLRVITRPDFFFVCWANPSASYNQCCVKFEAKKKQQQDFHLVKTFSFLYIFNTSYHYYNIM